MPNIRNRLVVFGCLLCSAALALTACGSGGVPLKEDTAVILPTAAETYTAPIGDAALEYTGTATLYLPRHDGTRLISLTGDVTFSAARLDAESIVRALLLHPGDGVASPLGGEVKLSLYGVNPVETSGDVATVNLAASALQLDRKALYLCGQAIANTLTELPGIRYVNLLVMDKQIGLDIGSTLPAGAFTRNVGTDVGAVYEQALSQRVQAGEQAEAGRFSATVALYFPLSSVFGMMAEARNIAFSSQTSADMVTRILQELGEGPVTVEGSPALPLLSELLVSPPEVADIAEGGGRSIALRFDAALDDMLSTMGVSRASCMASLCYTLSSFIPNVTSISVMIGEEAVDHLMLGATAGLLLENGQLTRSDFASLLMDGCTLYFADAKGEALAQTKRPILYYLRTNPRALLLELFRGPNDADSVRELQPVIPPDSLSDADILGLSMNGRTLLVNFSRTWVTAGGTLTRTQDRLLAYAIVNTLLCGEQARRVQFFTGGQTPDDRTGEIDWAGPFYRSFGISNAE